MSEYSSFYIGGNRISGWPNGIGAEVSVLFTEDDVTRTPHPNWIDQWDLSQGDGHLDELPCFQYESTAWKVIDRLELLGFTMEGAREDWEQGVQRSLGTPGWPEDETHPPDAPGGAPSNRKEVERRFYASFTFDEWSRLVKKVLEERIQPIWPSEKLERAALKSADPHLYRVLAADLGEYMFGYAGADYHYFLRAALEVLAPETLVVLDCSVLEGWVPEYHYACTPPQMVVLTEGTTDRRIIEGALKLLYPHLTRYFNFVDLDAVNMQSNTGQLVNIAKAFVAAGITKPTLVVLDNDSAGHDAHRLILNLDLPPSLKVMTLPYLPLAAHYPTIGPQGATETDINGTACSIELYLGRNMLEEAPGKLTPVKYGGYVAGVQRWQGEILDKQAIQQRYQRFLGAVTADHALLDQYDLSGIRLVLNAIFEQFQGLPLYGEEGY